MRELQTKDVAALLGITKGRVSQLVSRMGIKPRRIGQTMVFTNAQYRQMAARNTKPGPFNGRKK